MNNIPADSLQQLSPCDVAALQKCLKDNDGNTQKCLEEINAFQRACGKAKTSQAAPQQPKQTQA